MGLVTPLEKPSGGGVTAEYGGGAGKSETGLEILWVGEKGGADWFADPGKGLAVLFIGMDLWASAASDPALKPFCWGTWQTP